jgi:hypothetical protein
MPSGSEVSRWKDNAFRKTATYFECSYGLRFTDTKNVFSTPVSRLTAYTTEVRTLKEIFPLLLPIISVFQNFLLVF